MKAGRCKFFVAYMSPEQVKGKELGSRRSRRESYVLKGVKSMNVQESSSRHQACEPLYYQAWTREDSRFWVGENEHFEHSWPEVLVLYLKRPRAKRWELRRCVGGVQIQRLEGSRPAGQWGFVSR